MSISKFILSVLFSLISYSVLAQDNPYELVLPMDSVIYDSINIDCMQTDSVFIFKVAPTEMDSAVIFFTLVRGRRVIYTTGKKVLFSKDTTYFSVAIPLFWEGDNIHIEQKGHEEIYIITPKSYYREGKYEKMANNSYSNILTFKSRLYENTTEIKLDSSFVDYAQEYPLSDFSYCKPDSFFVKKLNDSIYFINSSIKRVWCYLNQDISQQYWPSKDKEYNEIIPFEMHFQNNILDSSEFYNKTVTIIRGKIDYESIKEMVKMRNSENANIKEILSKRPYLFFASKKNRKMLKKGSKWLYYSITWTDSYIYYVAETSNNIVSCGYYEID